VVKPGFDEKVQDDAPTFAGRNLIYMSNLHTELQRRRTFGIVSHPDAGKTTLTEKLLLFGGAIQEAGAVKSNKIKKGATSDFMEIERQRGISVATSVMAFEYQGKHINILDTPGHQDFAEDTYRTLTAVDSAIVVVDVAKGVEAQTEKLVNVCRMRATPIIVFINKLDREGRDAFDLLDEVEQKLGLRLCPLSWPIGMGAQFQGVYDLWSKSLLIYDQVNKQKVAEGVSFRDLSSPELVERIGAKAAQVLREELELVHGVYPEFDREAYLTASPKLLRTRSPSRPTSASSRPTRPNSVVLFLKFTPTLTPTTAAASPSLRW
jgi:peptide chain release factor 3